MIGRPTIYSEELSKEICMRLARGESLRAICKTEGMPNIDTVLTWALDSTHPFSVHYAIARDIQMDVYADSVVDVAREADVESKAGVMRARLEVDAIKWISSKLKPKRYGEKIIQEITDGNKSDETRQKLLKIAKHPEGMKAIEKIRELNRE